MSRASLFVILATAASLAAAFLMPPMPRLVAHHDCADRRAILGVLLTAVGSAQCHLAAAFAGFMVCRMLWRRALEPAATAALRPRTDRARRVPPPAGSASIR